MDYMVSTKPKASAKIQPGYNPKGLHTSPEKVAKMIAMRITGMNLSQIAQELELNIETVHRILRRPEIQAQMSEDTRALTAKWRRFALGIVPEAMQCVDDHVRAGDLEAAKLVLQGVQVFTSRSELEVTQASPLAGLSPQDLLYTVKHGHLPTESCTCEADFVAQSAPMLVAENVPEKDPDKP